MTTREEPLTSLPIPILKVLAEFENGNNGEEEDDVKREDGEDEVDHNGYIKSDFLKIPITVSAAKTEKEQPTDESFKQTDENEVAKPSQNSTKKTGGKPLPEKEIDIVQVPNFPEPGPKYDTPSPRRPHHREGSCCGYRENNPPCHHFCNQGIVIGVETIFLIAVATVKMLSPCCPYDETNARNHHNESQDHCYDGDPTREYTSGNHHHHQQDGCCENQDYNYNYNCKQDVDDDDVYDDAKSVEELLEEYLEDIDEKTERIHDILDDYAAMDLFISVHGFQPEEVHVTAKDASSLSRETTSTVRLCGYESVTSRRVTRSQRSLMSPGPQQ
uniref:Uncharacterized protein n=1 Tax=Magallana gigas TaxID=29159 RepID=A0A8W8J8D7_MAGGI